jgi:hypothetical protein
MVRFRIWSHHKDLLVILGERIKQMIFSLGSAGLPIPATLMSAARDMALQDRRTADVYPILGRK